MTRSVFGLVKVRHSNLNVPAVKANSSNSSQNNSYMIEMLSAPAGQ